MAIHAKKFTERMQQLRSAINLWGPGSTDDGISPTVKLKLKGLAPVEVRLVTFAFDHNEKSPKMVLCYVQPGVGTVFATAAEIVSIVGPNGSGHPVKVA